MENKIIEEILKSKGKNEIFIRLIKRMFEDNNISIEKGIEILKYIYK